MHEAHLYLTCAPNAYPAFVPAVSSGVGCGHMCQRLASYDVSMCVCVCVCVCIRTQTGVFVVPVFISVDPERDTPARIKTYVHEFHPKMLGLTGDLEDIKKTSKAYRWAAISRTRGCACVCMCACVVRNACRRHCKRPCRSGARDTLF